MMHQNTKSGNKLFGGLEDIVCIHIAILTLRCDFDLECSNQNCPQDAQAYDDVASDQI